MSQIDHSEGRFELVGHERRCHRRERKDFDDDDR